MNLYLVQFRNKLDGHIETVECKKDTEVAHVILSYDRDLYELLDVVVYGNVTYNSKDFISVKRNLEFGE